MWILFEPMYKLSMYKLSGNYNFTDINNLFFFFNEYFLWDLTRVQYKLFKLLSILKCNPFFHLLVP